MSRAPAPGGLAAAQLNNALKLHQSGQHDKALQSIQRVLVKNPKLPDAHYMAAGVLIALGDLDRAMYHAEHAAKIAPDRAEFQAAIGSVHATDKRFEQSIPHYQRALALNPELPDALNGLGVALKETGHSAQAIDLFDRLIKLQPNNQDAIINRALLDANAGRAHAAVARLDDASKRFPSNPVLHDILALSSSYDDELTPQQACEFHERFGRVLQSHLRARTKHDNTPDPARRIRIGYISAEFRRHSNAYFLAPILDHHDHDRFEVFLYSTNGYRDEVTDRLQDAADHWRLHRSNDLRGIIDTILEDKIDILVELTGHFASNNLPVLATRPAPVQITYLGYGNTTGLTTIDHRIIDATTDPAPVADALNTENLIRVDGCFLTYEPSPDLPPIREPDPARPFTFASFNDLKKLTPSTVDAWAKILHAVPASHLIIKNAQLDHEEIRQSVLDRFAAHDLGADRVRAIGRIESMQGHLDLYNDIDLALDTFPYTGTTTTCEALSMGVEVLTLVGNTHAGRVSASILQTINRPDLCAHDTASYIHRAAEHAEQGKRSAEQRNAIREHFINSPICDARSFVPKLEAAYIHAWTQWCEKQGTNA